MLEQKVNDFLLSVDGCPVERREPRFIIPHVWIAAVGQQELDALALDVLLGLIAVDACQCQRIISIVVFHLKDRANVATAILYAHRRKFQFFEHHFQNSKVLVQALPMGDRSTKVI